MAVELRRRDQRQVLKQDNNGNTFLITQADPAELLDHAAADQVAPGPIGSWLPPNARDLQRDDPKADIEPTGVDPAWPAF